MDFHVPRKEIPLFVAPHAANHEAGSLSESGIASVPVVVIAFGTPVNAASNNFSLAVFCY